MFGLPGGNKNMRTYPTVQKVMDKFYEIHEGSYDADITKGEIPKVKWSTFMYVFFYYTGCSIKTLQFINLNNF